MSEGRHFCPRCGSTMAPGDDEPPAAAGEAATGRSGRLCPTCFVESIDLLDAPEELTIRTCTHCGAVQRDGEWVDPHAIDGLGPAEGPVDLTDVAIDAVGDALRVHRAAEDVRWWVEPEQVDVNTLRMHCEVVATVRGRPVESTVVVPVRIERGTCPRCGRIAGNSFAGVVQVRAHERGLTDDEREAARDVAAAVVDAMAATGDREAFITEIGEVDGGVDVKVSTTKIARKIARRLVDDRGGTVSESETLVTEDGDGNGVYRVTYAVRLPPFAPGDVIDPRDGDGPVLVSSARGPVRGRRLESGEPYESAHDEADRPEADRLGTIADAAETTLVAVEDEHAIQVLDPETYEARTIARPSFVDPDAATIPVLKSRAGLHALPPSALDDDRAAADPERPGTGAG